MGAKRLPQPSYLGYLRSQLYGSPLGVMRRQSGLAAYRVAGQLPGGTPPGRRRPRPPPPRFRVRPVDQRPTRTGLPRQTAGGASVGTTIVGLARNPIVQGGLDVAGAVFGDPALGQEVAQAASIAAPVISALGDVGSAIAFAPAALLATAATSSMASAVCDPSNPGVWPWCAVPGGVNSGMSLAQATGWASAPHGGGGYIAPGPAGRNLEF